MKTAETCKDEERNAAALAYQASEIAAKIREALAIIDSGRKQPVNEVTSKWLLGELGPIVRYLYENDCGEAAKTLTRKAAHWLLPASFGRH